MYETAKKYKTNIPNIDIGLSISNARRDDTGILEIIYENARKHFLDSLKAIHKESASRIFIPILVNPRNIYLTPESRIGLDVDIINRGNI